MPLPNHAYEHPTPEDIYKVGDLMMLSTENHCRNYKHKGKTCVAKFKLQSNGPYTITHTFPKCSEYTLKLPNNPSAFPGFHTHLLRRYVHNDPLLFPDCELA
jgi:hypothetical protein